MAGVREYMDVMAAAQAEQAGWLQRFAEAVRADERAKVLREVRTRVEALPIAHHKMSGRYAMTAADFKDEVTTALAAMEVDGG